MALYALAQQRELIMTVGVLINMKTQVIKEFDVFLKELMIGRQNNYDKILRKISFIEAYPYLDNVTPMYEFLMNY